MDADAATVAAPRACNQHLVAAGDKRGGEALMRQGNAKRARRPAGRTITLEGPFTESRESVGGSRQLERGSLDQAVRRAGECPGALLGSIDVRLVAGVPFVVVPDQPAGAAAPL